MSDTPTPQAGWYRDPENPAAERWWNGSGWSDHRRDSTTSAAIPVPSSIPEVAAPVIAVPAIPSPAGAVPPPVDGAGFTFGAVAPVGSAPRPDPYAQLPAPAYATPYTGYSNSPYVAAPYGAPAYGQGVNGLALAGVLVSSLGWIVIPLIGAIAGIILSSFGLAAAKRRALAGNPNTGRGLALAGLVVGIIVGAFSILVIALYLGFLFSFSSYN